MAEGYVIITGNGDDESGKRKRQKKSFLDFFNDDFQVEEKGSTDGDVFNNGKINIKMATNKIITLKVKGSDTIGNLKVKIQEKEDIPFNQQELMLNNQVLENTNILASLLINKESTLKLVRVSRGFINISIKSAKGDRRDLDRIEVKPSDTIRDVRARMCHGNWHVLMFNGKVLDDSATVADLHIIDGSILTHVGKSDEHVEIFVNTFTGKTVSLRASLKWTIADVKSRIQFEENIPCDEQALIFNKVVLRDDGTLFDYHINVKSTLTLMRKSRGFMKIFVKTLTGGKITVKVRPSDTISDIKAKIQDQENIPCDEQELVFNEMVLHNDDMLFYFNINRGSTLTLMRLSSGFMNIFIKPENAVNGKTVTLNVKPSDTIHNVKSKYHEKEQDWDPSLQRMYFNGTQLHDNGTLADYRIHNESTVDVVLLFREY